MMGANRTNARVGATNKGAHKKKAATKRFTGGPGKPVRRGGSSKKTNRVQIKGV